MELKHVAKKAAKKSAKKAAAKHSAKHAAKQAGRSGNDTRRAYEHLGRVQSLAASMQASDSEAAKTLALHAEQALRSSRAKDAAELLRAAEHVLFGALANVHAGDGSVAAELLWTIEDEYRRLVDRAVEHGGCEGAPRPVAEIFRTMQRDATAAMKTKRYRAALELARGAEALTHVDFELALSGGSEIKPVRE